MVFDPDLDLTRVTCDADADRGGGADAASGGGGGDSCNEQVWHTEGVSLMACDSPIKWPGPAASKAEPVGTK